MVIYTLSFLTGIGISLYKFSPQLLIFILIIAIFYSKKNIIKIIIFTIFGYLWSILFIQLTGHNIDDKYHNKYVSTTGVIASLIKSTKYKDSFTFQVNKPFNAKLKLAIYGDNRPPIKVGEKWLFTTKIKNNNGYANQGIFNYEKWLFSQRIDATGYVNLKKPYKFISATDDYKILKIRKKIRDKLEKSKENIKFYGVINAILIGDKSLIKNKTKTILQNTGTSHLSVISGLHLSIITGVVFIFIYTLITSLPFIVNRIPAIIIVAFFTIIATFIYMVLADFSTPTVRAFLMISIFMLSIILRNNYSKWQIYLFALFIVMLINPLSIITISFWLSFFVAAIIVYFTNFKKINSGNILGKIKNLIYLQLTIIIISAPFILYFFNAIPLLSPVANIIAIPVFSLIIVPFSFIALILAFINLENIANFIFLIVDKVLSYLFDFLYLLSNLKINILNYTIENNYQLILLFMAIIMLFSAKQLKLRPIAIILLITIFNTNNHNNHLYILDVGQGSASIFAKESKAIIFDTGNKFISGFNQGDLIIKPFLTYKNINEIEKIIISHGDRDHIGGFNTIMSKYQVKNVITPANKRCNKEIKWQFAGWNFQTLTTDNKFTGNNSSCVIRAYKNNKSILWTGDIEKQAEKYLIKKYKNQLKSDILIVPHHGSKTSSSIEFLTKVKPKLAIISAGFQNSYKHPAKKILKRYKDLNIKVLSTICSGQISINLDTFSITEYRKQQSKTYQRQCKQ